MIGRSLDQFNCEKLVTQGKYFICLDSNYAFIGKLRIIPTGPIVESYMMVPRKLFDQLLYELLRE